MTTLHGNLSDIVAPRSRFYQGPYGRLFPDLSPHQPSKDSLLALAQQMVEPADKEDNEQIPAAYTYFGQLVTHDITFDSTSSLMRLNDPNRLYNFRTPRFDLDSLYGAGPEVTPYFYDQKRYGYLLTGKGGSRETPTEEDDLLRTEQGTAVIGDPRNDENVLISQVQLAFIKFHNKVMAFVEDNHDIQDKKAAFRTAQQLVRWHYQWVVIHDFLPLISGHETVQRLLPKAEEDFAPWKRPGEFRLAFYNWREQPFMPVEFAVAAFRFGHSMIRPSYALNDRLETQIGELPIFTRDSSALSDLRGGRFLPRKWTIQWDRFLNFPESSVTPQFSKKITEQLVLPLAELRGLNPANLALRDLQRGVNMELPSGQDVARAMALTSIVNEDGHDPLWFYILREAAVNGGKQLGPVGGNIVAEVLVGLLAGDALSFVNVAPNWQPLPEFFAPESKRFELKDIIYFAGMPITADEIPS